MYINTCIYVIILMHVCVCVCNKHTTYTHAHIHTHTHMDEYDGLSMHSRFPLHKARKAGEPRFGKHKHLARKIRASKSGLESELSQLKNRKKEKVEEKGGIANISPGTEKQLENSMEINQQRRQEGGRAFQLKRKLVRKLVYPQHQDEEMHIQ